MTLYARLLVLIGFMMSHISGTAGEFFYKRYTYEDDYCASMCFNIVQDHIGQLWYSSNTGFCKFDGSEFSHVHYRETQCAITYRLYTQPDGTIWGVTSEKELVYVNPTNGETGLYEFNHLLKDYPEYYIFNSFYVDRFKNIYLGVNKCLGLIVIDSLGKIREFIRSDSEPISYVFNALDPEVAPGATPLTFSYPDPEEIKRELPHLDIIWSKQARGSQVWSTRVNDHAIFGVDNELTVKGPRYNWRKKQPSSIIGLGPHDEGTFWMGTWKHGASFYSLAGALRQSLLSGKSVSHVMTDHEGGLWLSTLYEGVFYVRNPAVGFKNFPGLENEGAYDISEVPGDALYITYEPGTTIRYDRGKWSTYFSSDRQPSVRTQYSVAHDGLVLASINEALIRISNTQGTTDLDVEARSGQVTALSEDGHPEELLMGNSFGFSRLDKSGNMDFVRLDMRVRAIHHDDEGIYCGTNLGLFRYHDDGSLDTLAKIDPAFSRSIVSIVENSQYLFVGTCNREPLIVFNEDTLFKIGKKNGLFMECISILHVQNDSVLWVGTNEGLNRIIFSKDGTFRLDGISAEQGLIANNVNDVWAYNDSVWVATNAGVCLFPESMFGKQDTTDQFLRITEIWVNDSLKALSPGLMLTFDSNRLKVGVKAILLGDNKFLQYRYRLEGLENTWSFTKEGYMTYPSLPPGEYKLIVQSSGKDRRWELNEISLPIVIKPPYYATLWFRGTSVLMIGLVVYLFFRLKILMYNRDIVRELLRYALKKIRRSEQYLIIKEQGKDVKIASSKIYYLKSEGNYLEVVTETGKHLIRGKIGTFKDQLPDPIEFLRVHRSYIIRLDKVEQSNNKAVWIGGQEIPISKAYRADFLKISE